MMADNVGVISPWALYAAKMEALFELDEEVIVTYDNEERKVLLLVDNPAKADALSKIVPEAVEFGDEKLAIAVVPANDELSQAQVIRQAFEGNPVLADVLEVEALGGINTFALFEPDVTQFRSDDIQSPWGVSTMTYEQLARDVLNLGTFVSSAPLTQ